MSVQVNYKGNQISSFSNTTKTLKTSGKYLEDDVTITESLNLQSKTATPTESQQTISSDTGYEGLSSVTVNAIPSSYIIPSGTISISANGSYNVSAFAQAEVLVQAPTVNLQSKSVTPTEQSQTVTPDSGYDGLSEVSVDAISSNYVGSSVPRISSLSVVGSQITAPTGYYSSALSASVQSGSAITPATTITAHPGIVVGANGVITATNNGNSSQITPTVTEGYVTEGIAGTVTVSGSSTYELSTKAAETIIPTESQQTAVSSHYYTTGNIVVAGISSTYIGSAIERRSQSDLTVNGRTVQVPSGYYSENVASQVATGSAITPATTIIATPTISFDNTTGEVTATVSSTRQVTPTVSAGYVTTGTAGTITVSGNDSLSLNTKSAQTYTPSNQEQVISANQYLTGNQTILPIPSQYIVPTGTYTISSIDSATTFDVTNYASVSVALPNADTTQY